ncbi:Recombination endonuclease VII [uncultured Caudovirales phage]|uniref:Recombination endonuclease VII n=1 Tax=uncultured Caudovirales phage TaxID=2100421 RepID=A0A6J5QYB7_9CAUD|nr:Recombination endonuclease VII [uncultured Caudovirales phage]
MAHKDPDVRLAWHTEHSKKPHVIERKKREKEKARLYRQTEEGNEYYYGLNIKKRYGISFSEYTNLFAMQNGCCAICGIHQANFKRRLHIDHCHEKGTIRGLLCSNCNTAIGKLKDSPALLERAINYLLKQLGGSNDPNRKVTDGD